MKIYQFSKLILIVLLALLAIMPATAQEATEGEELDTIEITFAGYISFDDDGNIYIDGYFLAPAGAISPSLLSEGQFVEVTGFFLNDDTFKLTGIDTQVEEPPVCDSTGATPEIEDDCLPPVEEPTCDSTGATEDTTDDCTPPVEEPACDSTGATEDTADDCVVCDADGSTEDTADDCVEDPTDGEETCTPTGHPVAARIADAFDVSPCEVEAMHDAGNGFGNIAKAYLLAEAANQALLDGLAEGEEIDPLLLTDPQAFIDLHKSGTGWGQIVKASGVHPSDLAPGKLKKRAANDDDTVDTDTGDDADETASQAVPATTSNNNGNNGNGNGNGNANANANNGNNGNGNANANNGNGNNGNGNGKDKNKDKDKGKKKK